MTLNPAVSAATVRLLPLASTLLLLALSLLAPPFAAASLGAPPPLAFIGVCVWAVQRPEAFGIVAAFLIGLLQDLLTGAPLGVTAFLYALAQRQGSRRRATLRTVPPLWQWGAFVAALAVLIVAQTVIWGVLADRPWQPAQAVWQWLAGTVCFVPVAWLLLRAAAPAKPKTGLTR